MSDSKIKDLAFLLAAIGGLSGLVTAIGTAIVQVRQGAKVEKATQGVEQNKAFLNTQFGSNYVGEVYEANAPKDFGAQQRSK